MTEFLGVTYRWARRCAIAVVGGTVVLIGIAMIALPGPAVVVIPAGLAILALEFAWAKVWLKKVQDTGGQFKDHVWSWYRRRGRSVPDPVDTDDRQIK